MFYYYYYYYYYYYLVFIETVFVILKQSSVTVLQKPNISPASTVEDFLSPPPPAPILWYLVDPNDSSTYNQSQ